MPHTLHILNGDATLQLFEQSSIEGETFVWREVLAEGPVHPEFNSYEFWNERRAFMTDLFSIETGGYDKDVYEPFMELSTKLHQFDEIVLWFEYDLFCQINMMALISYLGDKREPAQTISMVCSGRIDNSGRLFGLGELTPQQLEEQLAKKLKLNTREFDFAKDVYRAYCSNQPDALYTYSIMPSDEFWYIADALKTHFRRFPNSMTGLTEIEQKVVDLANEGVSDQKEMVGKLLKWQKIYGFGDLQYFATIVYLKPLFADFDRLKLKAEPELSSAIKSLDRNMKLGGATLANWQFNPQLQELEMISV